MEALSISQIWRYFRWLPKFVLRRVFNKERLSGLVYIDVRPRYDAVSVITNDSGTYDIYFQLINMSPFEIELDRAEIDFNCAGVNLNKQYIKKKVFKSGEISEFHVKGNFSSSEADTIAKFHIDHRSNITLSGYFNCSLHNFNIENLGLEGVRVRFSNAAQRKARLEKATNR